MGKKWWSKRRYALYGVGCITSVLLIVGSVLYFKTERAAKMPAQTDQGAVVATADLLKTITNLRSSFNSTATSNPKSITTKYIDAMKNLQKTCGYVQTYKKAANSADKESALSQYLNNSALLCDDLSQVAANSEALYTGMLPVLSINPHLKRFQTLPLIKGHTHSSNLDAATKALEQTRQAASKLSFSSQSVSLLSQLQTSIKQSKDLAYYPELADIQSKLLVERERYWNDYGDLSSLQPALQTQLSRYCSVLTTTSSSTLPACKNAH